jgi:divalent metal cation (Fe/Co/Zn/Cd) transporter
VHNGQGRRFDWGSLVAALFFLAVAVRFLIYGFGRSVAPIEVTLPVVLIGLGVVSLTRILTRSRRRSP